MGKELTLMRKLQKKNSKYIKDSKSRKSSIQIIAPNILYIPKSSKNKIKRRKAIIRKHNFKSKRIFKKFRFKSKTFKFFGKKYLKTRNSAKMRHRTRKFFIRFILEHRLYQRLKYFTALQLFKRSYSALLRGQYMYRMKKFRIKFRKRFFWKFELKGKDRGRRIYPNYVRRILYRVTRRKMRMIRYKALHYLFSKTNFYDYIIKINPRVRFKKVKLYQLIKLKRRLRRLKFKHFIRSLSPRMRKNKKKYKGILVIFVETKNNFIISCVNKFGELIYYVNASSVGAKGRRKRLPHTAELCGKLMRKFLFRNRVRKVSIIIKSRLKKKMKEAIRGFMRQRIKLSHIVLRVPLTHNGVRQKKLKRK